MTPQEKIAAADPARELLKRAKTCRREKPADGPSLLLQAVQLKIKERYGDGDPWQQMLVQSQQTGDRGIEAGYWGLTVFAETFTSNALPDEIAWQENLELAESLLDDLDS